jgi:hypothetical protein
MPNTVTPCTGTATCLLGSQVLLQSDSFCDNRGRWTGAPRKGMVEAIWALRGRRKHPRVILAGPGARDDGQL